MSHLLPQSDLDAAADMVSPGQPTGAAILMGDVFPTPGEVPVLLVGCVSRTMSASFSGKEGCFQLICRGRRISSRPYPGGPLFSLADPNQRTG